MKLLPRDTCCDNFGNCYDCDFNSGWNSWGRWVALAVIIVAFLILFVACSCFTARRRRRMGRQPYYGTGWAANGRGQQYPPQNPQNTYYAYQQPAPPYEPSPIHGDQLNGIELNRPGGAYGGYDAPPGPPPAKR